MRPNLGHAENGENSDGDVIGLADENEECIKKTFITFDTEDQENVPTIWTKIFRVLSKKKGRKQVEGDGKFLHNAII